MSARNPIKFAEGQAHRTEILAILERYGWREPLAKLPPAKLIREQMTCIPVLALRTVQWHITELRRLERERLQMQRTRNVSAEPIGVH